MLVGCLAAPFTSFINKIEKIFQRGHSNRRSKHNAAFSWNCPKLLVQAFVLFRDSFRDWQPKMLQTCTHAMESSTMNMRTKISNVTMFFLIPPSAYLIIKRFPSAPISTTEQIETYTPIFSDQKFENQHERKQSGFHDPSPLEKL